MFNAVFRWGLMGHMIPILKTNYVKLLFKRVATGVLVAGIVVPGFSSAQDDDAQIAKEYFVQQGADEALLIKVNAFEAEFESRLSTQNGKLLLLSGIPGSRIVPVFQYVNAQKEPRQLDIEVTSSLHTKRSDFGLGLTRLQAWDDRSSSVSRAYQLLSFGMEASKGGSAANWSVKIDALVNAGKLFQRFGMKEMRLWSNYLAAHLVQHHLHDHSFVYTMTREILRELKESHFQKIELATLQLQSAALIGLKRSGTLPASEATPDPVQSVLSRAAMLAESMGFRFEQANALSRSGEEYALEAFYPKALEQFKRAVAIADSVGDAELATTTRESIVQIHAVQGDVSASSQVLQEIETQLLEGGDGDELALNLLAQGRLFIHRYRYGQALEVLAEALTYQNNSAIRKQIHFEMAKIFFESGRLVESAKYLKMAGAGAVSSQKRRANSVIDTAEGLNILASIYRSSGAYEQMRTARKTQGKYRPSQAQYLYDQGLDELAAAGRNRQSARSLFRQSYTAAKAAGHRDLQNLSRLQLCALGAGGDELCSRRRIETSYENLTAGGIPRLAAEAMFLRAQILVAAGRRSEAITVMGQLADEVHLFRHSLPGVLGAWYQERHEEVFEYYLALLVRDTSQQSGAKASTSLLALSKIRYIEKYSELASVSDELSGDTDLLRTQLAQRAAAKPGKVLPDLNDSINRGLAEIRQTFRNKSGFLSKDGLRKYLHSLSSDEVVLTYHISATSALVWVAHRGKVQQRSIANAAYLYSALQEARQGLADIGNDAFDSKMDALGKRLITPVADMLKETIYWVAAGPLLGFPLDALRVKGQYLVERHTVVNLLSFPANIDPGSSLRTGPLQKVFLAGHPQDYSSDYATRLDTSAEIRALADIFVGPGLRIVQGAALLPDEFQDERFQQANMVHLSMPGVIDLRHAEQSSLELSGIESGPGRASFNPKDIRSQKLLASLVFLSSTRMNNSPVSGFNARPGLISDFTDAGAHSVIANLWASNGKSAEAFVTGFYHELEATGDIAGSLTDAKRQYLKDNRENGLYDWAGYQLFIP